MLRRYRRRAGTEVVAVQLDLETDGFTYQKWGSEQRCKSLDWLVNNQGEVYTIDQETFATTYRMVGPGRYVKHACVWAEVAIEGGAINTKEGQSCYRSGDYLVYNAPDKTDGYAVSKEKFQELYANDS